VRIEATTITTGKHDIRLHGQTQQPLIVLPATDVTWFVWHIVIVDKMSGEPCISAECRLSFSRAEIVLLNSWIPVQQILYHVLRVFVKTERLTDSSKNSDVATLSNYHIKTLMLWACN